MSRKPKPWYWSKRNAWFVTIDGKRYSLGADKKAAEQKFYELMGAPIKPDMLSVFTLMDEFLEWTKKHRAEDTYTFYQKRIVRFASENRDMPCTDLRPFHIQRWLDDKAWSNTYKAGIVTTFKRCFNWGVRQGYISSSPILFLDKPKSNHRETPVSRAEYEIILANTRKSDPFYGLVVFSWETGCRPQESLRFTSEDVDVKQKRIVMVNPKAHGPRWRVIHLNPTALKLVRKCDRSEGPVFRNTRGRPWTTNACSNRFDRLKEKTGRTIALYDFRHAYGTDMLKAGVDPITVAELMGHSDVKMLMQVYQHLSHDSEYIQKQVRKRK